MVIAQDQNGFAIENSLDVGGDAAAAYALLEQPARWWNGDHTYSGDACNLILEPRIGGCFCETLPAKGAMPESGVEYARIVYRAPFTALRLVGSLGPLQAEAVTGTLTFALKPIATGTHITMTYVVGGHVRGGADQLAAAVEAVLGQQLQAFRRAADK